MIQRFLALRKRYKPDWRDKALLATLRANSRPFLQFCETHPHTDPLEAVGSYFRTRTNPRFFVDPAQLKALARGVPQVWRERLLRLVNDECSVGLRIYGRRGPVLMKEFPWGRLEPGPGGDKLYRKRPHRFAFAPRLALAALYGQPTDRILSDLMLDWMGFAATRNNDLAYDSNLTVIQRVLALSWTWAFLAGRERCQPEHLSHEGLVLKILREDIRFLAPRLGQSYANNHLLADVFAGWFVGLVWPELLPERDMAERFEPLWLGELGRQVLDDGTNFEHSTHYHEYAWGMAAAYVILKRRNGQQVPEWVLERTSQMWKFQADLAGVEASTLSIGRRCGRSTFPVGRRGRLGDRGMA